MTLRFLHWVSIKLCTSAFGFDGFPILTERKNTEKKPQNTAGNENENPAPQGSKWTDETITRYITRALVALVAIPFHEAGHALAAWLLGDATAKREGRLSLKVLAHHSLVREQPALPPCPAA